MEEDQVPNRALLQHRFERYEALAEALCRQTGLPETVRRLERLRARLRQGPVRLLVVGVSCSGKSTLINALAGEFVAPEGNYVTSCVPLWVTGRRPDSENNLPLFNTLNWGEDGSFCAKTTSQANALGKLCHVLDYKVQVPEGLEAVTAQVSGGFLWDSGLTLVDTPGIGQQAADDTQTRAAIDRGAELLLIAHRAPAVSDGNGSDTAVSDAAFLQSLFPGGSQDLRLDMKRDLFLLGNNDPGGKGTEAGIRDALKKLVFQWNMQGEKRFYWVNVLRQRQRVGYYHYRYWFPDGADLDTLMGWERPDKHARKRLERARRQVGEQAGEEELFEAEDELETQDKLKELEEKLSKKLEEGKLTQAECEEERERFLKIRPQTAPTRKKTALKDSRNMDKLRRDLTARALELYEDPDRLCAPIEAELLRAVRDLAEDCRRKIGEKTEQIKGKFAGIPDERLSSRELTRLREQDKTLSSSIDRLARAADWLEDETRRFIREQEQAQESFQSYEDCETDPRVLVSPQILIYSLEGGKFDISTDAKTVRDGTWPQEIVKPLTEEYIRRRSRVQTGLANGTLPMPEGWVSPEHWTQRLDELIRKLNHRLPEGTKQYALSDRLLHPDPDPFLAAVQKAARADVREIEQGLCQRFEEMQMNWPSSMAGKLTGSILSLMANKTVSAVKAVVEKGLDQSLSGIGRDMKEYIRYQKDTAAKQQDVLKKIRHELCKKGENLEKDRRNVRRDLAATAVRVRGVLLDRQLKEELAPLEQELQRWDELSREKNWMEVSL